MKRRCRSSGSLKLRRLRAARASLTALIFIRNRREKSSDVPAGGSLLAHYCPSCRAPPACDASLRPECRVSSSQNPCLSLHSADQAHRSLRDSRWRLHLSLKASAFLPAAPTSAATTHAWVAYTTRSRLWTAFLTLFAAATNNALRLGQITALTPNPIAPRRIDVFRVGSFSLRPHQLHQSLVPFVLRPRARPPRRHSTRSHGGTP